MRKIAAYDMPRKKALLLGLAVGVAFGILNLFLDVEFLRQEDVSAASGSSAGWLATARPFILLALKLIAAVVATVVLHEGLHGLVATLFGHRPRFGLKPPLVFVTFDAKVPRGAFILIALTPLVLLDIAFGLLLFFGVLPVVSYMCLMINTIGAVGDVWITTKLLPQKRGVIVQDTKTGIEVWENKVGTG